MPGVEHAIPCAQEQRLTYIERALDALPSLVKELSTLNTNLAVQHSDNTYLREKVQGHHVTLYGSDGSSGLVHIASESRTQLSVARWLVTALAAAVIGLLGKMVISAFGHAG